MVELFASLRDAELLTPVTTIITGLFAIIAVLLNNFLFRLNLSKQLQAQSIESEKKLQHETFEASQLEKKQKLELLHESIQKHLEVIIECQQSTSNLILDNDISYQKIQMELLTSLNKLTSSQRFRRKALLLGYSYSDYPKIAKYLEKLEKYDKGIRFDLGNILSLTVASQEQEAPRDIFKSTTLDKLSELNSNVGSLTAHIEAIEKLVTQEIRETRSFRLNSKN